ncbi:MAG: YraN family protein [Clostridiales bacterium]|jgi:putative endonuclease|nr:YraN family protein [Clostridiales bacterium]
MSDHNFDKRNLQFTKGGYGETIAEGYLRSKGYVIVEKGYRCPYGEIDIIAMDGGIMAFIEVKMRQSEKMGYAAEAVTLKKQRAIIKTAQHYISKREPLCENFRFDVAEVYKMGNITVRHIENAFYYE